MVGNFGCVGGLVNSSVVFVEAVFIGRLLVSPIYCL